MSQIFQADTWVWIPDEEEMALPAKVLTNFKAGDAGKVRTEDGEDHDLSGEVTSTLREANTEVLNSKIDNLINLNDLNESAILHNLRIRFKQDVIYTNVSTICISVNPFKLLPLYTPEMMDKYRENAKEMPPHVFKIADGAYKGMLADRADQSIIISGESGAGKSEATKLMLQYIADISSRAAGVKKTGADNSLEQQILQANPVMEAFGNAKTVRNNNSSRFGKLITVKFESNGSICGGSIINYLLEKSRVIFQAQGERNYHMFYQLIAGCKSDLKLQKELGATDPQDFHYLDQSGVVAIEGHNDEKDFDIVRRAFRTLGMDEKTEVKAVLQTVAAVLHVGNVAFEVVHNSTEEDSSAVSNMSVLESAAKMLGLDPAELNKSLTSKNVGTHSRILVPYDVNQATATRDALAKKVYGNLFQFLIDRINKALAEGATSQEHANIIGVLDIFGFESFQTGNSFEQLCINYCNEKLQFHFNEHIFRLEQEVYDAEGVDVPKTDFKDNQHTIDMLEMKGTGIFPMIDEEINVPRGSDDTLLNKLRQTHKKHESFKERPSPKLKVPNAGQCFGVVHYAGEVFYDVSNFLEKNKDELHKDLVALLHTSSNGFVSSLFPTPEESAATPSKVRSRVGNKKSASKTLGAQFKSSLASLMTTLNASEPHFVRCMKPNSKKTGSVFEASMMLAQLRYSGLLEVCRIRKLGFPVRRDKTDFVKRYECVCSSDKPDNLEALIQVLLGEGKLKEGQYAIGKTKVFMKNSQANDLEELRDEAITKQTIKMQALIRSAVWKYKFRNWRRSMRELRKAIDDRSEEQLNHWIDMFMELPHGGKHLAVYKEAKVLQMRLDEERQVLNLLESAISQNAKASIKSAIAAASAMTPPFTHPKLDEAKEMLARIEKQEAVTSGLKKAVAARSKADIVQLLADAEELGMDTDEVKQAKTLLARLEEEEATIESLKTAIAERHGPNIGTFLSKASEMGIRCPEVDQGRKLYAELQAIVKACEALQDSIAGRDLETVRRAVSKAQAAGVAPDAAELKEAVALIERLESEKRTKIALKEATAKKDIAAIDAALGAAAGLGLQPQTCGEMSDAQACKKMLVAQETCRKALVAATSAKSMERLSAALADATRLGLSSPEVSAAQQELDGLSRAASGTGKLALVATGNSMEEIQAALADADALGLQGAPEYKRAKDRLAVLQQEKKIIDMLVHATATEDLEALNKGIEECTRREIANKYPEIKAARDKVHAMNEVAKLKHAIDTAFTQRDLETLEASAKRIAEVSGEASPDATAAAERLKKLVDEKELESKIEDALEKGDEAAVKRLYAEGKAMGVDTESRVMKRALVVVEREQLINETYANIEKATQTKDLVLLQKALGTAIQLGLSDSKIDGATSLREVLQVQEDEIAKVVAATSLLEKKMGSSAEIKQGDVDLMASALEASKASGQIPVELFEGGALEREEMKAAEDAVRKGSKQLIVQRDLRNAINSSDREALKTALDLAQELFLNLALIEEARILFKELDQAFQRAREETDELEDDLDADEMKRMVDERLEKAKHPKYRFDVYPGLRSRDDFAKSVLLSKRKLKDSMFKWTSNLIPKSLTELNSAQSKQAVQIHKSLMGYMGDRQMSFPATLAQDVLEKGLKNLTLRDEIYLQVMKQLTSNPAADSIAKGWQVMCMCVSTFPPSSDFDSYLLNFLLAQREKKGAVRNYARYCLRALTGMLTSGASGFVPSVEEIQAYKERPPILATIEMVDGTVFIEDLPVTPDLNVGKVVEVCTHFLGLEDERSQSFGVFVYDLGCDPGVSDPNADKPYADLERTPRPLRNEDFMGDIIVLKAREKRSFKFVFKGKIFLRSDNGPSDDPVYERLLYLQAEDEVINLGNLAINTAEDAARFAAMSYRIAVDVDFPTDADIVAYDEDLPITDFVPPAWRDRADPVEWAEAVIQHRDSLLALEAHDCQRDFIAAISKHQLYGAHFFNVRVISCGMDRPKKDSPLARLAFPGKSPTWKLKNIMFAFNQSGLWLFDMNYELLTSFGFADIYRWGGSSSMFSLVIWNDEDECTFELRVSTAMGPDMAGIILDYINAIMATSS